MATIKERFRLRQGLNVDVQTGVAPIVTQSTTLNTNLNADLLDGQHGSFYATDSTVVHLAGTETITGSKTFQSQSTTQTVLSVQGAASQTNTPYFVVKTSGDDVVQSINDNRVDLNRSTFILPTNASSVGLTVTGKNAQVSDLQQWKLDTGATVAKIDPQGLFTTEKVTTISDVIIGGNLTVNGTTTTIQSIIATVKDPVLMLGGDTPPITSDSKDRGIEFRWHNGVAARAGFFGFRHESRRFIFIPEATNTGEIFTGQPGDLDIGSLFLNGDMEINGGDITTLSTTFNLLNGVATTVNFAGAATTLNLGATTGTTTIKNNLDVDGDINLDGGDLTSTSSIFNLLHTPTTINFGAAATDVQIGSATGTTNVNNNLDVDGDLNVDGGDFTVSSATFNLANTNATTVNFAGAATDIQIGAATGTTNVNNNLDVDGDLNVDGGDITVTSSTLNLANTAATTINFGGAATDIQIGSSTGTTNINNSLDVDGDLNIDGGDLTTSATTFNLVNNTAETVNFAGSATDIQIGSSTGTTNINNSLDVDGDINIDGGDLTASTSTFNLLHTPTTINFGAAATDVQIGSNTGTTNVNNNLDVDGDVNIDGGDLTVSTSTFNLANTNATTVNFAGAATDIQIGAASGTTNVNNSLDVDGDINVDGGDFTTSAIAFNLINNTATTVNFAGAATDVQIGAATGTTNINHDLDVDGDVNIDGGDLTSNLTSFNLLKTNVTDLDFAFAATDIEIGATTGTTSIRNNADIAGDLTVRGGDIVVTTTAVNVVNTNATTVNFANAATTLNIGANTGTTTINNDVVVKDTLTIEGTTTNFNPPTAGTAPFTVGVNAFDVLVSGLNADKLDGQTGSWYQARANHTGTQLNTTISNWNEAVQDTVAPMFVHSQNSGISAVYNDDTGRVILTVAGGGGGSGGADFSTTYWMGV